MDYPRVMIRAAASDKKHRKALPTASTKADRNELCQKSETVLPNWMD